MAAQDIFAAVLEVVPDVNRRYVALNIMHVVNQFQLGDMNLVQLRLPSLDEFVAEDGDENYAMNFSLGNVGDAVELVSQTIIEQLIENPNYPKTPKPPSLKNPFPPALDVDDTDDGQRAAKRPFLGSSNNSNISPVDLDRPGTSASSIQSDANDSSVYFTEATQLLVNEFRWFYLSAINSVFRIANSKYTDARKLLLELVSPCFDKDLNIASIDPVHPQYPLRLDTIIINSSPDRFLTKDDARFPLLKAARKASPVPIAVSHSGLLAELQSLRKSNSAPEPASGILPVVCSCCFGDTTAETLLACTEGHIYCRPCMLDYVKIKIQDGVRRGFLECMENDCTAPFAHAVLVARLPNEMIEKLDERIAASSLNQAGLDNLVRCPKCSSVYELDERHQVVDCLSCKFTSCRRCGVEWLIEHKGKKCEEIESGDETKKRRLLEEKMTAELVRPCPKCKIPLMKVEGCNKLTCTCSATLCYVCRTPFIGYDHFCQHPRNPGEGCQKCKRCSLWVDPAAEDAARIKKLEAEAQRLQEEEKKARLAKLETASSSNTLFNLGTHGVASAASSLRPVTPSAKHYALGVLGSPMDISAAKPAKVANNNIMPPLTRRRSNENMNPLQALFQAIDRRSADEVRDIVDRNGIALLSQPDPATKDTAMHKAASCPAILELLLQLGAPVSPKDRQGMVPIWRAILGRHSQSVLALLERGETPNLIGEKGKTLMHQAAIMNDVETVRILLNRHANINATDNSGWHALHYVARGSPTIISLLISQGANVNVRNRQGNTPLHLACIHRQSGAAERIMLHGADLNSRNGAGETPLACSIRGGQHMRRISLQMVNAGASLVSIDGTGLSAVDFAAKNDVGLWQILKQRAFFRGGPTA